jgi:hypothetical protein
MVEATATTAGYVLSQASTAVGSIKERTSEILVAGKPPCWVCSWIISSS